MPQATAAAESITSRMILSALNALKRGDFSHRLPEDPLGMDGKIA